MGLKGYENLHGEPQSYRTYSAHLIPVEFTKFKGILGFGRGYSFVPAGDVNLVAQWNGEWIVSDPCDPANTASFGSWAAENHIDKYATISWMPVVCYPLTAINNPNSLNIPQDEFTTFAFPDVFTPKND